MKIELTVIIPTHNPRMTSLLAVLEALRQQAFPLDVWELIIVDNASHVPIKPKLDLSWHPNTRIVDETRLGLTYARLAGFKRSSADLLVLVDDDNVLDPSYLRQVVSIFDDNPRLGAIGGKSLPKFEIEPKPWMQEFYGCLALRDLGEEVKIYCPKQVSGAEVPETKWYPSFAPVGAGMAMRRKAVEAYMDRAYSNEMSTISDRAGKSLSSGGDNDIVLTMLSEGWGVGYFPQLSLTHLIPAERLTVDYLARLNRGISKSWVQVLDAHGKRPWKRIPHWSVLPRKIKAFFTYKPWQGPAFFVRWQGACGHFEGLSQLSLEAKNK